MGWRTQGSGPPPAGSQIPDVKFQRLIKPRIDSGGIRLNDSSWIDEIMKRTIRKILVILSNRLNRNQKVRFVEIDCDDKGTILKEHALRGQTREASYHEVWENDDGKTSISSCNRFKRKYRHALERPKE